jgi:hypothetical protein
MLPILWIELSFPIEIGNLSGDLYRGLGNVKRLNSTNTALTADKRRPVFFPPDPDRRDASHAGNDYSPKSF